MKSAKKCSKIGADAMNLQICDYSLAVIVSYIRVSHAMIKAV